MRLKRGCGCFLVILAIGNLALTIAAIAAAVRGPQATSTYAPSTFMLVGIAFFFAADVVASVILALAAIRGVSIGGAPVAEDSGEAGTGEFTSGVEGEDEGTDGQD
jgi:hypothetical protein